MKEKVPLFKSWRSWYIFILVVLLCQIVLFEWITNLFK